jgi:LytS/YehU family sensor histidine kinase
MSISDPERQVVYLEFVAKFVKYGFTCQDKSTISLALEIDQVIGIIKGYEISNECNLDYHIEINPEDMGLPVIPFLVITVVENALYYGDLDKSGKKLKMSLSRLENNLYCLEFSGYTMPDKNNISKPGKGHGLYILKERLKFMHYDKSTNTVKGNKYMSLSPNGLSLKMILPI